MFGEITMSKQTPAPHMPVEPSPVIYLDYHATTPCDPRVVQAMLPYFTTHFGNPASVNHWHGQMAHSAVERARQQVAHLIGSQDEEVVFTSGATESNNIAILGVGQAAKSRSIPRNRVVASVVEHKSVLGPCQLLERDGFEIVILPVDASGTVDLEVAATTINSKTLLVSIQVANQELGTIQPIQHLVELAHSNGALIHCDAAQAIGKIPFNVEEYEVDLLSLSAHKMFGPKGIGALYLRGSAKRFPLVGPYAGGGQEWAVRPGTLNVPAIIGFGEACHICSNELSNEPEYVQELRDLLERQLLESGIVLHRNGALNCRLPGNSNVTFMGVDAEALIANLPELAISTGSACNAGALEPSPVLTAIGLDEAQAYQTIRFGLGRFTTRGDVLRAADLIIEAFMKLR